MVIIGFIVSVIILISVLYFFLFKKKSISEETKNIKKDTSKNNNLDKGFHPEILYLINKDYAEYVDFEEV